MRDYKFRAWITPIGSTGFMRPVVGINLTDGALHSVFVDPAHNYYAEQVGIELMQYAGLKDKSGREIYEGDIVRYAREHYRGKEAKLVGEIIFYEPSACFMLRSLDGQVMFWLNTVRIAEVVGNIYEKREESAVVSKEAFDGHKK